MLGKQKKLKDKYQSPIDEKPLRRAGQSLEEEETYILEDKITPYALAFGLMLGVMAFSWVNYFYPLHASPFFISIVAISTMLISFYKISIIRKKLKNVRQGLEGEKYVGDLLDEIKQPGCYVLHDFVDEKGNIDHIVINHNGVFIIETKTLSKPIDGSSYKLKYDGETISYLDGAPLPKQPLDQAQSCARALREFISKKTGENCWVQPIVVFPRWFINSQTASYNKTQHKVWVCNPKNIKDLVREPTGSKGLDSVDKVYNELADYIRNYESTSKKS